MQAVQAPDRWSLHIGTTVPPAPWVLSARSSCALPLFPCFCSSLCLPRDPCSAWATLQPRDLPLPSPQTPGCHQTCRYPAGPVHEPHFRRQRGRAPALGVARHEQRRQGEPGGGGRGALLHLRQQQPQGTVLRAEQSAGGLLCPAQGEGLEAGGPLVVCALRGHGWRGVIWSAPHAHPPPAPPQVSKLDTLAGLAIRYNVTVSRHARQRRQRGRAAEQSAAAAVFRRCGAPVCEEKK